MDPCAAELEEGGDNNYFPVGRTLVYRRPSARRLRASPLKLVKRSRSAKRGGGETCSGRGLLFVSVRLLLDCCTRRMKMKGRKRRMKEQSEDMEQQQQQSGRSSTSLQDGLEEDTPTSSDPRCLHSSRTFTGLRIFCRRSVSRSNTQR
ncbi:hypothetical protein F2P81_006634 [Scophthalmus maximus]|uniref:Uncharacterized protein n=1 Tax=Scophthalmus maximus TaxID=52904 RepID=A0A6A4SZV1_SCOMX|nr:hypothetical protein F2P81_006634 [Scophthalmus maximus]